MLEQIVNDGKVRPAAFMVNVGARAPLPKRLRRPSVDKCACAAFGRFNPAVFGYAWWFLWPRLAQKAAGSATGGGVKTLPMKNEA
jgi:hypothetical protein